LAKLNESKRRSLLNTITSDQYEDVKLIKKLNIILFFEGYLCSFNDAKIGN